MIRIKQATNGRWVTLSINERTQTAEGHERAGTRASAPAWSGKALQALADEEAQHGASYATVGRARQALEARGVPADSIEAEE